MTVDYAAFFEKGKAFVGGERCGELIEVVELGELHVTTGELVACDPLVNPERAPFERAVPFGDYPVLVSLLDDGRIAFAMVRTAQRKAVRWEYAGMYAVDSATGCFADAEATQLVLDRLYEDEEYANDLIRLAISHHRDNKHGVEETPNADSEANLIMFLTGYGDGCYDCYWGLGDDDEVVALVTDFKMVDLDNYELGDPSERDE